MKVQRFLDRRTMPRALEGKPQAVKDEVGALVATVARYAPRGGVEEWWPRFEAALGELSDTRAWPTEGEVRKAAQSVKGPALRNLAQGDECDPINIAAKRMAAGDAVGDGYLWGRMAVDLIARGAVSDETLTQYRSALFHKRKALYGPNKALAMESADKDRHASAERDHAARVGHGA